MSYLFASASSQYLAHGSSAPVTSMPLTMACWYKPTTLPAATRCTAMSIAASGSNAEYFVLGTVDAAVSALKRSASGTSESTGGTLTTGTWYHLAAVFASATSTVAYLNGVAMTAETTSITPSVNRAAIGCTYRSSIIQYADGTVARPAWWNTNLSATQVGQLASGVYPDALTSAVANLVAYPPLNGNVNPELDSVWV